MGGARARAHSRLTSTQYILTSYDFGLGARAHAVGLVRARAPLRAIRSRLVRITRAYYSLLARLKTTRPRVCGEMHQSESSPSQGDRAAAAVHAGKGAAVGRGEGSRGRQVGLVFRVEVLAELIVLLLAREDGFIRSLATVQNVIALTTLKLVIATKA